MKKMQSSIGLLITALFLVACDQNTSPISDDQIKSSNNDDAKASKLSEFSINSLNDTITVKLPSSFYQQDIHSQQEIDLPKNSELEWLLHDAISNIGFYIVNHGETNKNIQQYNEDLSNTFKKQNNVENINIELNDNQQLNYQYTISSDDYKLNESCVAIINSNLYSVCAFSNNQDFSALNNTLKQISVKAD